MALEFNLDISMCVKEMQDEINLADEIHYDEVEALCKRVNKTLQQLIATQNKIIFKLMGKE